jgi:hypothetical protein
MPRRYRTVCRPGSLGRDPRRILVRSFLLGLACVAVGVFCSPISAAGEPRLAPKTLWEAFPLNPTSERIDASPTLRPSVLRPPAHPAAVAGGSRQTAQAVAETTSSGSGSNIGLLALVLAVTLPALVFLASTRAKHAAAPPREVDTPSEAEPSAYISAVFVGSRRLEVIEGVARQKRRST